MKRFITLAILLLSACGGTSGGGPLGTNDGGFTVTDAGPTWTTAALIDGNSDAGLDLTSAVDNDGNPAVAYFRKDPNVFLSACNADAGCPQYALVIARESSTGAWTTEQVPAALDGGSLTGHYGLSLAFDPQNNPAVAYMGGDISFNDPDGVHDDRWIASLASGDGPTAARLPSDLVIARKSGTTWTRTTLATSSDSIVSDKAQTTSSVDDQGAVTGLWAGLIFDKTPNSNSFHVVTRDLHFGAAAADFDGSNTEYAHFISGQAKPDIGEMVSSRLFPTTDIFGKADSSQQIHGGGTYSQLVLGSDGQPAVSFATDTVSSNGASQVWFARRTTAASLPAGTNAWTRTQVANNQGRVGHGPSLAFSPTHGYAIALLGGTVGDGDLQVTFSADGVTWPSLTTGGPNTVEALGDTGYHPSVDWSVDTLGLLYGFCHGTTFSGTTPCDPVAQQLRFRIPGANGPLSTWSNPETVASIVPDAAVLTHETSSGKFVAIWKEPGAGLKFSRRTP
ncbi:MAG TPA: hypothetical protein VH083_18585 [Myxococcales bacterium]|nr:hypothetical protein [Myxococcales bacterium]